MSLSDVNINFFCFLFIFFESRPLSYSCIYTRVLNQFRKKSPNKVNILRNTRASVKCDLKNGQQGNPVSFRINHFLISYLISKQARLNGTVNVSEETTSK